MDAIINTYNRIVGYSSDSSASRHLEYYELIPQVWKELNISRILLGVGTSASGKPYSDFFKIYAYLSAWNAESDFIFMLIGNGIAGATVYYFILGKLMIFFKAHKREFLLVFTIFVGGFGYIYIRSSWSLLLLFNIYNKYIEDKRNLEGNV
jgi:hypothetical protein